MAVISQKGKRILPPFFIGFSPCRRICRRIRQRSVSPVPLNILILEV